MHELIPNNKLLTGDMAKVMSMLISHAKLSVFLACYYVQNPILHRCHKIHNIFIALDAAKRSDIDVKVLLNYQPESSPKIIHNVAAAMWLLRQKIPVRYLPRSTTLHAKLLIVDSRWIITGSHNLSPTGLERNAEVSFLLADTRLATAANNWFLNYWRKSLDFTPDMV